MMKSFLLLLFFLLFFQSSFSLIQLKSCYTTTGRGNNLQNPQWGEAFTELLRLIPSTGDTLDASYLPNARMLSNVFCNQTAIGDRRSERNLTDMIMIWGQWVDHDLDLTTSSSRSAHPIPVPKGDPVFDPDGTGDKTIYFERSIFNYSSFYIRQQLTEITSFLDASMIYGSNLSYAGAFRAFRKGKLASQIINGEEYPPWNLIRGIPFQNMAHVDPVTLILVGDVRGSENPGLVVFHTLFLREHNYWCDRIIEEYGPELNDEVIFQAARRIVAAEIQHITFNEYLNELMGGQFPPYHGYDPTLNPGIENSFSTATFRYGHSEINSYIPRLDAKGKEIYFGNLSLADGYFNPSKVFFEGGIDPILRGYSVNIEQEIDPWMVDEIRNILFGRIFAKDLCAIDVTRTRDHGLMSYNQLRQALNLKPLTSFDQITNDPELVSIIRGLYNNNLSAVEIYVGMLAEPHLPGSSLGETLQASLIQQLDRTRSGDRCWYENREPGGSEFSDEELAMIKNTKLSDIIKRNTKITCIPDNIFRLEKEFDWNACPVVEDANGATGFFNTVANSINPGVWVAIAIGVVSLLVLIVLFEVFVKRRKEKEVKEEQPNEIELKERLVDKDETSN